MGEGVREGLTGEGRDVQIREYVLEVPIGSLGPLRTANDQWGAFTPSSVPQRCTILYSRATTSGTFDGPSTMR